MDRVQLKVLFQVPFFAPGLCKLPVVWDPGIPTACTDGKRIRFNPEFFDTCTDQQAVTVVCEEVGHCLLGHLWRAPAGADWDMWNAACDHSVRNIMREYAETVTSSRLADPFPMPDPVEAFAPDPVYRGVAEEVIYNRLAGKKPPGGAGGGPGQNAQNGSQSASGVPTPAPGGQSAGNQAQRAPSGALGQMSKPQNDPAVQKQDKSEWEQALKIGRASCRERV